MKRVRLLIVLATAVELLTPSLASAAGSPVNPPTNLRVLTLSFLGRMPSPTSM